MKNIKNNKLNFSKKSIIELTDNKLKSVEGGSKTTDHNATHSVYSRRCGGAANQDINLL